MKSKVCLVFPAIGTPFPLLVNLDLPFSPGFFCHKENAMINEFILLENQLHWVVKSYRGSWGEGHNNLLKAMNV